MSCEVPFCLSLCLSLEFQAFSIVVFNMCSQLSEDWFLFLCQLCSAPLGLCLHERASDAKRVTVDLTIVILFFICVFKIDIFS